MTAAQPLVVLDDDPTGTQAVRDVPVLLDGRAESLAAAAADGPGAIHVLTNSRAFPAAAAYRIVHEAAAAARDALPGAPVLIRGDSTLRGHLLEEYLAVRDAQFPGREPVLMLVPALPAAGRVTIDGVHWIERAGVRTRLDQTEYARDPAFGYSDAHLLRWAHERSGGHFPAERGLVLPLDDLRSGGPTVVANALGNLAARGEPAVLAPDAASIADLGLIADGLRAALRAGVEVIVRSAPAFAGVYAGTLATGHTAPPEGVRTVLVLSGSYVATSTRQLGDLLSGRPHVGVEADVRRLASADGGAEVERLARDAARLLEDGGLAVVATSRTPLDMPLEAGMQAAVRLAEVLRRLDPLPDVVIAKGGITSAVAARHGVGASAAWVAGPLIDGVALWRVPLQDGGSLHYVVFPGNVGDDEALTEVVELLRAQRTGVSARARSGAR